MSEHSPDRLPPEEVKALLDGRPYLIQRLGFVANNAGIMPVFQGMLREDRDFVHIKNAISTELERQGVQDVDDLLRLFEIPDEYDN